MPRIQVTSTGQYIITIPVNLVRALQLEKGDELLVQLNKSGNMELVKLDNGPVCTPIPGRGP